MLGVLLDEGMNVARLNFSHGDHAGHEGTITRLKQALEKRPGVHCAIMLDTKGPEIRTGFFDASVKDKLLKLKKGSTLILTSDYEHKSTGEKLGCTYGKLSSSCKPGAQILCADGSLVLEVSKVLNETEVACTVLNDCAIGERKNMNLPGVVVDLPVLQDKDTRDLQEFACKQPVDFVAASFVQSADDVRTIRKVLDDAGGKHVRIISKIENQEGLENFEAICKETDAVMVARGDLGMEIPPERVFREQKKMITVCNREGIPVIVATQMLESMCSNPRPTRAECSDVANAVLDGADAVMLSGETAGGNFPKESVAIMARTCLEAEAELDFTKVYETELALSRKKGQFSVVEATVAAAVQAARDARAAAVVVLAKTGATAQLFAKYKLSVPLIVVTSDIAVARYSQAVVPGCKALCLPDCTEYGYAHASGKDETKMVAEGTKYARSLGIVANGDDVLLALHSYRVADEKNMAMRFFHASSVL